MHEKNSLAAPCANRINDILNIIRVQDGVVTLAGGGGKLLNGALLAAVVDKARHVVQTVQKSDSIITMKKKMVTMSKQGAGLLRANAMLGA